MKKSTLFLLIILSVLLLKYFMTPKINNDAEGSNASAQGIIPDDATSGIDSITTTNYANPTLEYYYYIPKSIVKDTTAPYLIMVTGLSGKGQDFVSQQFKDFAKKEGLLIIAPSFIFDDKNFDDGKSYQYPDVWSGAAFNNLLRTFDAKHNIEPSDVYMFGFSAGAQFVSRYATIYPNYVKACVFNSAGGTYNPTQYNSTKFYVAIGTQDTDGRKKIASDFYNSAIQQHIYALYKEYPIRHELSQDEINDELLFIHQVKNGIR